ncbi:hypothetical protein Ae406Ps2_3789 [Pseudonocardia sp. Ae406_Ps2]|nr:hypothetical protein Ae406Ps2_3789 [Pseudonocardia sp. Ae406_Ps2]
MEHLTTPAQELRQARPVDHPRRLSVAHRFVPTATRGA